MYQEDCLCYQGCNEESFTILWNAGAMIDQIILQALKFFEEAACYCRSTQLYPYGLTMAFVTIAKIQIHETVL